MAFRPSRRGALTGLSAAALALGRDEQANTAFTRALRSDASAILYRNRAYAAFAAGRDDVAVVQHWTCG